MNELTNILECSVCLETISEARSLKECQHTFCQKCITTVLHSKPVCPECRIPFSQSDIKKNYMVQGILDQMKSGVGTQPTQRVKKMDMSQTQPHQQRSEYQPSEQTLVLIQKLLQDDQNAINTQSSNQSIPTINTTRNTSGMGASGVTYSEIENNHVKKHMDHYRSSYTYFTKSVSARDGVKLDSCRVNGEIKASMGKVKAKNSFLNEVSGRDGVELISCTLDSNAKASMDKVYAEKSILKDVSGRDGVKIIDCKVGAAKASMDKVYAENSTLSEVIGRDGCRLIDSSATTVSSSMGKVHANGSSKRCTFDKIKGRDGITLYNVDVKKSAKSSFGSVKASLSFLKNVKCSKKLTLDDSTAENVTISTDSSGVAAIHLNGGRIEGDIVVEKSNSSGAVTFGNIIMSGNSISIGGIHSYVIGEKKIQKVGNMVSLNNFSYPFTRYERNLLHGKNLNLSINSEGYITDFGGNTVTVNGNVINPYGTSSAKMTSKESLCELRITGNGVFTGKVRWSGCKGTEVLGDGIKRS